MDTLHSLGRDRSFTDMPILLIQNYTQSIRLMGLIGLFTIGFIWDAATMTENTETALHNNLSQCSVRRTSEKNGFHREVITSLIIPESLLKNTDARQNVHIFIKEHIPSGLYVDLYQTKAAEEFGGPQVYSAVDIDVEKPEYLSPAHDVHVFSQLRRTGDVYTTEVTLPIHLRYHRPSAEHSHDQIHLEAPQLFLNVTGGAGITGDSGVYEQAVCDSTGHSLCTWQRLSCTFEPEGGKLEFSVPVGHIDHGTIVVSLTLSITIFSTLFLAHSILKQKPKLLKQQ